MKLGRLKSLGHNVADSMASGIGLAVGYYAMDIFGEACTSSAGYLLIDMLTGETSGAEPSPNLRGAIARYREVLPEMCRREGLDIADFRSLQLRFGTDAVYGRQYRVTVEAIDGRASTDQYVGMSGRRLRRRP